jgi:hypothetical protein
MTPAFKSLEEINIDLRIKVARLELDLARKEKAFHENDKDWQDEIRKMKELHKEDIESEKIAFENKYRAIFKRQNKLLQELYKQNKAFRESAKLDDLIANALDKACKRIKPLDVLLKRFQKQIESVPETKCHSTKCKTKAANVQKDENQN